MESRVISLHQITVLTYAFRRKGWFTTRQLSAKTEMSPRTARHHLKRLTELGILDRRRSFSGCH
jgi:DNA-binding transcriptional ArsR family regulator